MSKVIGARIPEDIEAWLREQAEIQGKTINELIKELLEKAMDGDSEFATTEARGTHACPYCGVVINWNKVKTQMVGGGLFESGHATLVKKCSHCDKIIYRQSDKVFELQKAGEDESK